MPNVLVRGLVVEYFSIVRDLIRGVFTITTGVGTTPDVWEAVLREPGSVAEIETEWIRHVTKVMAIIGRYIRLVQQWREHVVHLCHNLHLTKEQRMSILYKPMDAMTFLAEKDLDADYMRWVAADATAELNNLIERTWEFLGELPPFLERVRTLQIRQLRAIEVLMERWTEEEREHRLEKFHRALARAYNAKDEEEIKRHLASYLACFSQVMSTLPIFVGEDDKSILYHSDELDQRLGSLGTLEQLARKMERFVEMRAETYDLFVRHEEAMAKGMLPPGSDFMEWRRDFLTHPEVPTEKFIPTQFDRGRLLLGAVQSLAYLTDVSERISAALSLIIEVENLLIYLQSDSLNNFLSAERERANLFFKYAGKLAALLEEIQLRLRSVDEAVVE